MFLIVLEAKPTSAATGAHDIAGGNFSFFVQSETVEKAETLARERVLAYAWIPTSLEQATEPTPEQIAACDDSVTALHRKALREGIAFDVIAWPKVEGKEGDPIDVRPLGAPILDDTKRH